MAVGCEGDFVDDGYDGDDVGVYNEEEDQHNDGVDHVDNVDAAAGADSDGDDDDWV